MLQRFVLKAAAATEDTEVTSSQLSLGIWGNFNELRKNLSRLFTFSLNKVVLNVVHQNFCSQKRADSTFGQLRAMKFRLCVIYQLNTEIQNKHFVLLFFCCVI